MAIEKNQEIEDKNLSSASIIDSFAVLKIKTDSDETKLCFFTINDKFLIEKDETNSEVLNFYEYDKILDIKISFR